MLWRCDAGCRRDSTSRSWESRSRPDDAARPLQVLSRRMLRGAGIVALVVIAAACGGSSAAPKESPSVPVVAATWTQDLTFNGDVAGHMAGIVADTSTQQSGCTGAKPRAGQTWADEFFGLIDSSGEI